MRRRFLDQQFVRLSRYVDWCEMQRRQQSSLAPCEFISSDLIWKVDLLVASTVEAVSPVVDRLMQLLKTTCCPVEHEFAVEMALREALTNAIIHGNREDPGKKVRLCCACDSKRGILIVVKDQGQGFDPATLPSPLVGENVYSEHGRGIYLVNMLMDEVEFRRGGTEIYIRKDTHSPR
jgi:serine/threonine-protein kinase RsbW